MNIYQFSNYPIPAIKEMIEYLKILYEDLSELIKIIQNQ